MTKENVTAVERVAVNVKMAHVSLVSKDFISAKKNHCAFHALFNANFALSMKIAMSARMDIIMMEDFVWIVLMAAKSVMKRVAQNAMSHCFWMLMDHAEIVVMDAFNVKQKTHAIIAITDFTLIKKKKNQAVSNVFHFVLNAEIIKVVMLATLAITSIKVNAFSAKKGVLNVIPMEIA